MIERARTKKVKRKKDRKNKETDMYMVSQRKMRGKRCKYVEKEKEEIYRKTVEKGGNEKNTETDIS